jgi:hypothetical protein
MATFDQLSAEQRAIIELVLKQGQTYEELSGMLGMPTARVRSLAREALVRLSPVSASAVDDDWRGQLADYLLNQQSGPEATATKGHLRRSEAARAWARSVLDSLEQFYDPRSIPTIPEGEPEAEREPRRPRRQPREPRRPARERPAREEREPRAPLSPEAQRTVRRRRLLGAGALALVALLALLVWPIGLLTGDDEEKKADAGKGQQAQTRIAGQLLLRPVGGARGTRNAGVAVVAERGGRRQLIVQAQLEPNQDRQAYEVWLYNSRGDARSLGAQVTDRQGTFQGAGPLPKDFERFRFIDVSREQVDQDRGHSGQSVLRGAIADIQAPPQNAQQGGQQGGQAPAPAPPQGGAQTTP